MNKPEISRLHVATCRAFKEGICDPNRVIYPSSGSDASPSQIFRDVTYVDFDETSINILKGAGLNAIKSDIRAFECGGKTSEGYDLLILQNPQITPDLALPFLLPGGYIIANNYHGSAKWLHERSGAKGQFDFIAGIEVDINDYSSNLISDISDYFSPVKTEEDLNQLSKERQERILSDVGMILHAFGNGQKLSGDYENDVYRAQQTNGFRGFPAKRIANSYVFRSKI